MRKITQFSSSDKFTEGTVNLNGAMGIPFASIGTFSQIKNLSPSHLAEKPKKILLHYLTEPPKINFVSVTSFLDGGVYGIDCNVPVNEKVIKEIFSVLLQDDGIFIGPPSRKGMKTKVIPVFDASGLIPQSKAFLNAFPLKPGSLVFEANSERHTDSEAEIYALLAVAAPEDPNQNYLLMEDSGVIEEGETFLDKQKSLARSIFACEQIENDWGDEITKYTKIYLFGVSGKVPPESHVQVQMIYCAPPENAIIQD